MAETEGFEPSVPVTPTTNTTITTPASLPRPNLAEAVPIAGRCPFHGLITSAIGPTLRL